MGTYVETSDEYSLSSTYLPLHSQLQFTILYMRYDTISRWVGMQKHEVLNSTYLPMQRQFQFTNLIT